MNKLVAKPVIKDQYWVVLDNDKKVGNVSQNGTGYDVKIHGKAMHFTSTKAIQNLANITFQSVITTKQNQTPYPELPTTPKVFNSVFDIKRKLHLFTKTKKSKCYYAAGWYVIDNSVVFCPKYIFIQRYKYKGPFSTVEEAEAACT